MLIHLFIPDAALRDAFQEQGAQDAPGTVEEGKDLDLSLSTATCLVIDEAACTKNNLKILSDAGAISNIIFFLGDAEKYGSPPWVSEFFAKPFRLGDVLARLQFYQHNNSRPSSKPEIFGTYTFEPDSRQVTDQRTNNIIRLTEKESQLLAALAQSPSAMDREALLAAVWGYDSQIDTHTLETHIYQLRRKLDPQGEGTQWLVNEQGAYRLNRQPLKTTGEA